MHGGGGLSRRVRRRHPIDLVCYRLPVTTRSTSRASRTRSYKAVDARSPVHWLYADALTKRGIDTSAAETAIAQVAQDMRSAFTAAKSYQVNHADWFEGRWSGLPPAAG